MRLAIDTNAYVAFARGSADISEAIRRASQIVLPYIVVAELRAGFRSGAQNRKNEAIFQRFLASERVSIAFADEQTTHHYATLFSELRRRGKPIPTNDLWIAALCLQNDVLLWSFDQHFRVIEQLPVLPHQ